MRGTRLAALCTAGGLALAAAGCGDAPDDDEDNAGGGGEEFKTCMVTDSGGLDDRSFNASAWAGIEAAETESQNNDQFTIAKEVKESGAPDDYEPNLQSFIDQGDCGLIIAVGGLLYDATVAVAEANPDQRFAIVDAFIDLPNVYSMEFNTAQSSFLAGYLAAGMTQTGTVATYGGVNIAPVTIFMDGYVEGVSYYNEQKGADVEVLGWNLETQEGSFADTFESAPDGKSTTETLVSQGADIVFPVAGQTGLGSAAAAQETEGLSVIWVDVDGCESAAEYCEFFLSTSVKNIPDAVQLAVLDAAGGGPMDGHTVGTLENDGVSLAPFHDFDDDVPQELKDELIAIQDGIVNGEIPINSPSQPAEM